MIGNTIGSYRITGLLGEGGMGAVYRATDNIEREVAIKALLPNLLADPNKLARFRSEAVALGRLHHPNIAGLYHLLEQNGAYFMVMEFVEGQTLETVVRGRGALPPNLALALFCDALRGFEHAHARGVIHRDIKPSNLMISTEGVVKITDFGIARMAGAGRMTQTGKLIGTLEYMSPEQVKGLEQDARSDIYSLGILLFELLSGRMPYSATTDYDIMRAHLEDVPPPLSSVLPGLPPELDGIIARALAKDPNQRFQSVAQMREALEAVTRQLPAPPPLNALIAPQTREAFATPSPVPSAPPFPVPSPAQPATASPGTSPSAPPFVPPGTSPSGFVPAGNPSPGFRPPGSLTPTAARTGAPSSRTASSNRWVLPVVGGLFGLLVIASLGSVLLGHSGKSTSDNTASDNAASLSGGLASNSASSSEAKTGSGGGQTSTDSGSPAGGVPDASSGAKDAPPIDIPRSIPGFTDANSSSGLNNPQSSTAGASAAQQEEMKLAGAAIGSAVGISKLVNHKYHFGFNEQGALFGALLQSGATVSEGFNLSAGQTYSFVVAGDKGVKVLDVALYNPSGNLVRKGSKGTTPIAAAVVVRPPRAGRYKVSMTLGSAARGSAFCCLAALRQGAYDIPISDMKDALNSATVVSNGMFRTYKTARFNSDANTWAFYGVRLAPTNSVESDPKPYPPASRLLFAVGDAGLKNVSVGLYDANSQPVKTSTTQNSSALVATDTANSTYSVGVINKSSSPAFIMAFSMKVPSGSAVVAPPSSPSGASSGAALAPPSSAAMQSPLTGGWGGGWTDSGNRQKGRFEMIIRPNGTLNGRVYNDTLHVSSPANGITLPDGSVEFRYTYDGRKYVAAGKMRFDNSAKSQVSGTVAFRTSGITFGQARFVLRHS